MVFNDIQEEKTAVAVAIPEEEVNPYIFPQPEENFKVPWPYEIPTIFVILRNTLIR